MKPFSILVLLIFFFQGFFNTTISQNTSTQGKEFWVSFSYNVDDPNGQAIDPLKLGLVVSAKRACSGTITNPYTGWSVSFSVLANGTTSIDIPKSQAYVTTSETVEQKGLYVVSSDTISLYASNYEYHTFDVANILPIESLSDKYMIQTYATMKDATASKIYLGAEILIIATEDNTVVNITPSTTTKLGKPANITFSVTLNKGEVYQIESSSTTYPEGFSGSLVSTNDCKKIAVFNGNRGSNVPVGYSGIDYLFEQAFPTSDWGAHFVVTSTKGQSSDRIRVTALNDNTDISVNGILATTINSGQTYEFQLDATKGSSYIETTQACAVYQYLTGVNYGGGGLNGDPSMFWVSPIEQKIKEITFTTYGTGAVSNHYVNVVVSTSDVNTVYLDGLSISSQFKSLTGNPALSFAQISIANATHTLECLKGLIANVYGIGSWVSYAYTAGSNAINQTTQFEVDGILNSLVSAENKYCVGENIAFYSQLNYLPDSVYWYFDNLYSGKGDTINHSFSSAGTHKVTMKVKKNTGCFDSVSVVLTTALPDTIVIDTSIIKGQSYTFGSKTYTESAQDTLWLKNTSGCDSVVILKLSVVSLKSYKYIACPNATVKIAVVAESGKTYQWYTAQTGGSLLGTDTLLTYTKKNNTADDTIWLQVNSRSRIPIYIYLGTGCGSIYDSNCTEGRILFKEDFGGNNPSDPAEKSSGIPQVSYTYDNGMYGWGLYSIRKESHLHPGGIWYSSDDHTFPDDPTRGYLMQVDATEAPGQFYSYTLTDICPGAHLTFSCWMKSLMNNLNYPSKANVIFELLKPNGDMVAKYYSGDIPDQDNTWKQYGFDLFSPPNSDTLELKIINNGTGSHGNDFVMDDIEIHLCVPPITLAVSPTDTACVGDSVAISSTFVNDGSFTEPLAYKWFKKSKPTDSWSPLSNNAKDLIFNSISQTDQGYYRAAVSSLGSIDTKNCRAISDSVYLKVNACVAITDSFCQKYTFNGHQLTAAGTYIDTLTSNLGNDSIITLTLKEVTPDTTHVLATIVKGQSYTLGEKTYTKAIIDTLTLKNISGCDSVVILNLSEHPDNVEEINCYQTPLAFTFGIKKIASSDIDLPSYSTPVIGDIDMDGAPEILAFGVGYKNIDIFDAETLKKKADSIVTPYVMNRQIMAVGDVDGVGGEPPYIFFVSNGKNASTDNYYAYAYKYDKSKSQYVQAWKSDTQLDYPSTSTSIEVADLNNDGLAEVIVGVYVFNGKTGVLLAKEGNVYYPAASYSYCSQIEPYIQDLIGDERQELTYNDEVYSIKLTNTNAFNANAFTKELSLTGHTPTTFCNMVGGDFNLDSHTDLVMITRVETSTTTAALKIVVWDVYHNQILASAEEPSVAKTDILYYYLVGIPLIGDVDNDGVPEICFVDKNRLVCYSYNGTTTLSKKWEYAVTDKYAATTGVTLFDFNQDGKQEIIYRDESYLHILDGSSSSVVEKASIISGSTTAGEMPLVADVNNDSAAEIIVISGEYTYDYTGRLSVYASSTTNKWAPARPVWNQGAYNVINVNKDLTIPQIQYNPATLYPNGKRPFNAYRQQATTLNQNGDPFFKLSIDTVRLSDTICADKTYTIYGQTIDTAGSYTFKPTCDSVVILNLIVNPLKKTAYTHTICQGNTYAFGGKSLSVSGVYHDTLTTTAGCDSLITLTLQVNTSIFDTINKQICSGSTYDFDGEILNKTGFYTKTYHPTQYCDSTVTINLVVSDIKYHTITDGLCKKTSYAFAGNALTVPGIYTHTYQSTSGCDSIVTLILKQEIIDTTYIYAKINEGEEYEFGKQNLSITGIYNRQLQTNNGCDSVIILNLIVYSQDIDTAVVILPQGFSPNGDGSNDYFVIKNIEQYTHNHLLIFNRWGDKVYDGKPYANQWDGKNYFGKSLGGDNLPSGTYFYILDLGDGSKIKKGFVYLNR